MTKRLQQIEIWALGQSSHKIAKAIHKVEIENENLQKSLKSYMDEKQGLKVQMRALSQAITGLKKENNSLRILNETESKWISVEDRLPENYQDILIINKAGFQHVVHYNAPKFLYKPNRGIDSVEAKNHMSPTHWHPLPHKPQN